MTARPLVPATRVIRSFPKRLKNTLARYRFVLESKAQMISTVLQYHSSLYSRKWPDCSLEFELFPVAHEVSL